MCICWVDWGGKGFRWREGLKICVGVECRWGDRCVQGSIFFGGWVIRSFVKSFSFQTKLQVSLMFCCI